MSSVRLRIDHLAVEIADDQRVGEIEETLRAALAVLASRLALAPFPREQVTRAALERVELRLTDAAAFALPGAAAHLADELYTKLVEGMR